MTTSKKANITPKAKKTSATNFTSMRDIPQDIWLSAALGILTLLGAWVFIARWSALGYLPTSGPLAWGVEPAVLSALVAVFSILFIFRSLTHRRISLVGRVVAYVLIVTVTLVLAFVAVLSGQCDPYASNCSTEFLFRLAALNYLFFPLPVTLSVLSIIGSIALLVDARKR